MPFCGNVKLLFGDPMIDSEDRALVYVTMAIHGDGVPVERVGKAGSKNMEVYSTSSLLALGDTTIINMYSCDLFTQNSKQ